MIIVLALALVSLLCCLQVQVYRVEKKILYLLVDGVERSSLELRERFGATTYMALRALEIDGMVTGRDGETTPERAGRPRRYYRWNP